MKAILLLAVIATAIATTDFSDFKKIEKSELGKTLMDTIAVQLTNGAPLDNLFDMLFVLEHRYQDDQREDDAENRRFQDVCDGDLKNLDTDIANSEAKATELQQVLDALTPVRDQKVGQLKAKTINRDQVQKVVDENTLQRMGENSDFEKSREEFQMVSAILQEARRLFTDNLVAPSFLQGKEANHNSPQVMAQVAAHFQANAAKLSKLHYIASYGKAIKMLAALTSRTHQEANQELTGRVVKLIDDFQNMLNQSFDLERKAEDSRTVAFNKYVALLNKDINKYNSAIANLEAEIASLNDRIAATQASKDDTDQRTADKTTQRTDRRSECDEATYDYQQRRAARDSDKQTVSDLIGLLNSKLRELREYIALRLAAGDSFD